MLIKLFTFLLPWPLRRLALNSFFKYQIHPSAKIGLSWIFPKRLVMDAGSSIGHFTTAINLDLIEMEKDSSIGRGNWITGFPVGTNSPHFKHQVGRRAELLLKQGSSITKNHHIDCTNLIEIGAFTTIAGYQSQLLTHSIDLFEGRQDSAPISIGDYCFVGTNVVILGGSKLPSHSVLGAKSLLNKEYSEEWRLYGGVPAKNLSEIPSTAKYFTRAEGFVY
jgi:acetyltransferase-like isoleucine patch superfamily enzyme